MVTQVTYADGDAIIEQDAIGDAMYFLQAGKAGVYLKQNPRGNAVNRYKSGDWFGEVALIRDDLPRQATIKALGSSTCLRLGRTAFSILLQDGKVGAMMKQHVKDKYKIRAKVTV
jgi:cAMP-dependent protein kinase regulator